MVRPKPQLCPYTGQLQTRKDDTTNPRLSWFLSPSLQSRGRDRILTNSHPWNRKQSPSNFVFNILARDLSLTVLSCAFPIRAGCVWLQLYWPALSRSITVMCGSKIRTTHSTVIRAARAGDPHTLTLLLFFTAKCTRPPSIFCSPLLSVQCCHVHSPERWTESRHSSTAGRIIRLPDSNIVIIMVRDAGAYAIAKFKDVQTGTIDTLGQPLFQ